MADITLTVDVSSLKDAQNKLQNFGKEVNKFSVVGLSRGITTLQNNIRELFKAQSQGAIGSKAYQLGLTEIKRAYEQMGYSSQAATAAVRKYAAELQRQEAAAKAAQAAKDLARAQQEAAAAAQVLANRQQELRMRFQDGYALFTQQRQAMRDLREAYRANIVTLEQYQAKLAQIRAGNLSGHINQQAQGMSRFGVITQQAGYQVGDFFVQVQSGTNVLVAFGQQATQLVGTFAMLATTAKSIALFSGLGILISIGTAIGSAMMRANGSAKTLKDQLGELSKASSNLKENFDLIDNSKVETKFGDLNDEITSLTSSMLALNAAAELNNLVATLDKVKESASAPWWKKIPVILSPESNTATEKALNQLDEEQFKTYGYSMGRDAFIALTEGMQAEAKAGNREGVIALFDQFVEDATDAGTAVDGITDSGALLANQLYAVNVALAESNALLNGSADESKRLLEVEKARIESILLYNKNLSDQNTLNHERDAAVKAIVKSRDDEVTSLQQQRSVLETILTYGKDSAEVKAKEAEVARAIYMQEQVKSGILGNNLKLVMDEYDAMAKVKGEVEAAAGSAKTFADNLKEAVSAMQSLTGLGSTIEKALAVASAKVVALKNNADAATAGTIAGYRFDIAQKRGEAIAAGVDPGFVNPIAAKQNENVTALEKALLQADQLGQSKKGGSKGPSEDTVNNKLEEIYKYLEVSKYMVEQENIAYEQRQDTLEMALQKKLLTQQEYNQLELDLASKHARDIADIENKAKVQKLSTVLGVGEQILQAVGQQNEKAAKMARIFGAAQALADTYAGAAAALKLPFPANIAAAGSIISAGLGFVAAIRSGSTSARASGGSVGSATVASTASAPAPQTVFIDSISPDSLYSGETLINLFEAFYDENDKRGKVFMVAR
jgi:hypothetical protein